MSRCRALSGAPPAGMTTHKLCPLHVCMPATTGPPRDLGGDRCGIRLRHIRKIGIGWRRDATAEISLGSGNTRFEGGGGDQCGIRPSAHPRSIRDRTAYAAAEISTGSAVARDERLPVVRLRSIRDQP